MKFKKLLILSIFITLLSGCSLNISLYEPSNQQQDNHNNTSTDIDNNTLINVINPSNYTGTINYAPSEQQELSNEEIYKLRVSSSVYIISTIDNVTYLGSGVFFSEDISEDGYAYLFTNAHVVNGANKIEIVYSNLKKDIASIVGYHVLEDVAVLAVRKNNNYTIPTIKTSDKLQVASKVLTIGSPMSSDYSFSSTSGVISKIDSPLSSAFDSNYGLLMLQIDATLNTGNSGGPLFDKYGNLIGLNTMKMVYDEGYNSIDDFNFAIPIERAIFMANKFFTNETYTRGLLGVTIVDIVDMSISERAIKNIDRDYGLYVYEVLQTGASYNVLLANDIIIKINGIEFINKIQFQKELYNYSKNESVSLTILRNNEPINVTITLK